MKLKAFPTRILEVDYDESYKHEKLLIKWPIDPIPSLKDVVDTVRVIYFESIAGLDADELKARLEYTIAILKTLKLYEAKYIKWYNLMKLDWLNHSLDFNPEEHRLLNNPINNYFECKGWNDSFTMDAFLEKFNLEITSLVKMLETPFAVHNIAQFNLNNYDKLSVFDNHYLNLKNNYDIKLKEWLLTTIKSDLDHTTFKNERPDTDYDISCKDRLISDLSKLAIKDLRKLRQKKISLGILIEKCIDSSTPIDKYPYISMVSSSKDIELQQNSALINNDYVDKLIDELKPKKSAFKDLRSESRSESSVPGASKLSSKSRLLQSISSSSIKSKVGESSSSKASSNKASSSKASSNKASSSKATSSKASSQKASSSKASSIGIPPSPIQTNNDLPDSFSRYSRSTVSSDDLQQMMDLDLHEPRVPSRAQLHQLRDSFGSVLESNDQENDSYDLKIGIVTVLGLAIGISIIIGLST